MSLALLVTPHARLVLDGRENPCAGIIRLTADDGCTLVMTDHDAYAAEHVFDLVASSGMTAADLAEVHAYIIAEVIIPGANA